MINPQYSEAYVGRGNNYKKYLIGDAFKKLERI